MMSFATDTRRETGVITAGVELSSSTKDCFLGNDYLVVVRQKKNIVKVFQPQKKHITIGRSSSCSIILPDPRFPRAAGEYILGPIPIMRKFGNGQKNSEFFPVISGKPYLFRPYTLTLMEKGDILINRDKIAKKGRNWPLMSILLIVVSLGTGTAISQYQGTVKLAAEQDRVNVPESGVTENKTGKNTAETEEKFFEKNPMASTKALSDSFIAKQEPADDTTMNNAVSMSLEKKDQRKSLRRSFVREYKQVQTDDDGLDKAIESAVVLIERKNLKMAGRVLKPLLVHVEKGQRQKIIDSLDPPIQAFFEEAYMLKPYDPDRSNEILQNIVESGLTILPSYGKAKKMLDMDPEVKTVY